MSGLDLVPLGVKGNGRSKPVNVTTTGNHQRQHDGADMVGYSRCGLLLMISHFSSTFIEDIR